MGILNRLFRRNAIKEDIQVVVNKIEEMWEHLLKGQHPSDDIYYQYYNNTDSYTRALSPKWEQQAKLIGVLALDQRANRNFIIKTYDGLITLNNYTKYADITQVWIAIGHHLDEVRANFSTYLMARWAGLAGVMPERNKVEAAIDYLFNTTSNGNVKACLMNFRDELMIKGNICKKKGINPFIDRSLFSKNSTPVLVEQTASLSPEIIGKDEERGLILKPDNSALIWKHIKAHGFANLPFPTRLSDQPFIAAAEVMAFYYDICEPLKKSMTFDTFQTQLLHAIGNCQNIDDIVNLGSITDDKKWTDYTNRFLKPIGAYFKVKLELWWHNNGSIVLTIDLRNFTK